MLRIVVSAAEPRPARMLELVRANYSTATDLADALVSSGTLPFREAHHVVGAAVRLRSARPPHCLFHLAEPMDGGRW